MASSRTNGMGGMMLQSERWRWRNLFLHHISTLLGGQEIVWGQLLPPNGHSANVNLWLSQCPLSFEDKRSCHFGTYSFQQMFMLPEARFLPVSELKSFLTPTQAFLFIRLDLWYGPKVNWTPDCYLFSFYVVLYLSPGLSMMLKKTPLNHLGRACFFNNAAFCQHALSLPPRSLLSLPILSSTEH